MMILTMMWKVLCGIGIATVCSATISIFSLILLSWIVDIFRLNYRGNPMWILNLCMIILILSWILLFTYFVGGFNG